MSWVTSHFGLSLALGAFIAGMVFADSDYSHQVTADILPFRDVFNSLFFVSIGLLLSVSALIENLTTVVLWIILLVVGKALIVWAVVQFLGFPQRVAAMTRFGLGANRRIFLCAGKIRARGRFIARCRLSKFSRRFDYLDDCHAVYDFRRAALRLFCAVDRF